MTGLFRIRKAISAAGFFVLALRAFSQSTPPPPQVSGLKTATGIRIVSRDQSNPFEIEFAGHDIKPQSSERLIWLIDGKRVELMSARREWDLPPSSSDLEVLRAFKQRELEIVHNSGWALNGAEEQFSFATGKVCLSFAVSRRTAEVMLYAITVNADNVIALVATGDATRAKELQDYLQRTLLTLRQGEVFKKTTEETRPEETGATIEEQVRLHEALWGKRYVALMNNKLVTPTDKNSRVAIPLDPVTLKEVALLELALGSPAAEINVFDGQKSHAINLRGFDEATRVVKYWDPWGKGSFLQAENNHAGVAATPDPTEPRIWLMSSEDLGRVIYAVLLSMSEVKGLFRASTLLAGNPERAIATYKELQALDPNREELLDQRLKKMQDLLLRRHDFEQAITMYRIRVALDPATVPDKPRLAEALRESGQSSLIGQLDKLAPTASSAKPFRSSLDDAKKRSDFFTFFDLKEAGSSIDSDQNTVVTFKPTAPQFHDLIDLGATVDNNNMVVRWTLSIARSFLEDRRISPFAADFAKSFLQFTISTTDDDATAHVVKELGEPQVSMVPLFAASVLKTSVPAVATEAYLTYSGSVPLYEHRLTGGTMKFENVKTGETRHLLITIDSRQ